MKNAAARCRLNIIASNEVATAAAAAEAKAAGLDVRVRSGVEGEASVVARDIVRDLRSAAAAGGKQQPICLIYGGETTVKLGKNPGKGGRNQELALSAALALSELREEFAVAGRGAALLSGGTDGNDGPTDAAGALCTPLTVALACPGGGSGDDLAPPANGTTGGASIGSATSAGDGSAGAAGAAAATAAAGSGASAAAAVAQIALASHDAYPFFESLSGSPDGSGLVRTGPTGTNVADVVVAVVV